MRNRGFTILEIIITIGIAAVIGTLIYSSLNRLTRNQTVDAAANRIVSVLEEARVKTLASENGSRYGVHIENNKVTLFADSFIPGAAANREVAVFEGAVEISSTTVPGGNVLFKKLTGETDEIGTITVSLKDGSKQKMIRINASGTVEIE